MPAQLLDGKGLAQLVKKSLITRVEALKKHGIQPGLAVILVGDDPASHLYVARKISQCASVGIRSFQHLLPSQTPESDIKNLLSSLNRNPLVHGILMQLPLPGPLNETELLKHLDPRKDVDGLTPSNIGALVREDSEAFIPCTPKGCLKILTHYVGDIAGQKVVIIGRSHLVGRPLIQLFLQHNCTVTVVHRGTLSPEKIARDADILVAAAGVAKLVTKDWVKPGAIVLDVGINRLESPGKQKLVGDVDFESVQEQAAFLTPVPGGVGPMTVACLLENTLEAAERSEAWT